MARDLTVKTLSRNLLKKYGLGSQKEQTEETEQQVGENKGTNSGGARQFGRRAMTKERKDMIKHGSLITLG